MHILLLATPTLTGSGPHRGALRGPIADSSTKAINVDVLPVEKVEPKAIDISFLGYRPDRVPGGGLQGCNPGWCLFCARRGNYCDQADSKAKSPKYSHVHIASSFGERIAIYPVCGEYTTVVEVIQARIESIMDGGERHPARPDNYYVRPGKDEKNNERK